LTDYQALKDWLYDLQVFGIKLGLSSTEAMLARLGNPERRFPSVHLAGTNGKGSTAIMLATVLAEAGFKVGLYTSPHLVNFRERYLINGRMPTKKRMARAMAHIRQAVDEPEPPTFFEFTTALAFQYFADEGVDLGVIETGLGGRLDATNVLKPLISLVSDIALEHTQYLGTTLREIAWEKAGIIKAQTPAATTARRPVATEVLAGRARELSAPLFRLGPDFRVRWTPKGLYYQGLAWRLSGLKLGLTGRLQGPNAGLALAGLELLGRQGFEVGEASIRQGLARSRWPGRLETISQNPRIIVDGAHNPAACQALVRALAEIPARRLIIVFGVMADKDLSAMVQAVAPAADELILTRAAYERSAPPERLAQAADRLGFPYRLVPDLAAAVDLARKLARTDDLIVITGSLFVVGEVLAGVKSVPLFEEAR